MALKNSQNEIGLYYYKCNNAGDMLNEVLIDELFHVKTEWQSVATANLIAVGSVLERIIKGAKIDRATVKMQSDVKTDSAINVWGTGLMYDSPNFSEMSFVRPVNITALRGEKTRAACKKILKKNVRCTLADPGLLVPFLLNASEKPQKKYSLGIIPHFREVLEPQFKVIGENVEGSTIIDMQGGIKEVATQIEECECVISTSLHGLVIADAFGVPNMWCDLTHRLLGGTFKFKDYYSAYGIMAEPFNLDGGDYPTPEMVKLCYRVPHEMVLEKQKALIKAFPYQNEYTEELYNSI